MAAARRGAVIGGDPAPSAARQWALAALAAAAAVAAAAAAGRRAAGAGGAAAPGWEVVDPPLGVFPAGCRWREVRPASEPGGAPPAPNTTTSWGIRQYEYWDAAAGAWSQRQPAACRLLPDEGGGEATAPAAEPAGADAGGDSPASHAVCTPAHCVYRNLWYARGRWYLLLDRTSTLVDVAANGTSTRRRADEEEGGKLSHNVELAALHVRSAAAWAARAAPRRARGRTLLLDYVHFLHPTAIGHWGEALFPLYSALRGGAPTAPAAGFAGGAPPDRLVLLHVKRAHTLPWARAVAAAALGAPPGGDLPPTAFQAEADSVWTQIPAPLEGVPPSAWVRFDRVLVPRDALSGGGPKTFASAADARAFRAEVYARHGLPPPGRAGPPPRTILFQRKRANRRVVNEAALLALLAEFGEVRAAEFGAATPVAEQLAAVAAAGALVSVHTSALANAAFLRPGSAVVELIHRNWVSKSLDESFRVQTAALGDVHHYAWRATRREHAEYPDARDAARFAGDAWAGEACDTEECVEAHTAVDVVVDVPELRALLEERLPRVWAGESVAAAAAPWPSRGGGGGGE